MFSEKTKNKRKQQFPDLEGRQTIYISLFIDDEDFVHGLIKARNPYIKRSGYSSDEMPETAN